MVNLSLSFVEYKTFITLASETPFVPKWNGKTKTFLVEVPIEFATKYGY